VISAGPVQSAVPLVPLSSEPSASAAPSAHATPTATVTHHFVASTNAPECSADADYACGISKSSGVCAVGPRSRIDSAHTCPDFCEGFDGNLVTACRAGKCVSVRASSE